VNGLRARPTLWIILPLESHGQIWLDATSLEDELRLRAWLRRSASLEQLPAVLAGLLDDLDRLDEEHAA
jgi:hypothetical protein